MNFRNLLITLVLGTACGGALPTLAGHEADKPGAETRGRYDTARVIDVDPIVRVVRISEPQRRCWDEDYVVRYEEPGRRHGSTAGSAILGGIIGGAVGNAFGSGKGKDAATVAGVLIGSAIGHDRAVRGAERHAAGREETRTRTRCDVDDAWREEERIEGYDVTYEYMGDRYRTRMSHDPGDTLKVWVSVRPVGE
jgi:uncharacterized protein YcfJ